MRNTLIRIGFGCLVAGVSGAVDGAILALADPEHVMENLGMFAVICVILGAKGALLYFKQHERELVDAVKRYGGTAVITLAIFATSACAAATPAPQTAPASARSVIHSELVKAVDWAATAVEVARTTQKMEIAAYRNGRLSDRQHRVVQTAFAAFFTDAIIVLKTAEDLNRPDVDRWVAAKGIASMTSTLVAQIGPHLPPEVRPYLDSMKAILHLLGVPAAAEEELHAVRG